MHLFKKKKKKESEDDHEKYHQKAEIVLGGLLKKNAEEKSKTLDASNWKLSYGNSYLLRIPQSINWNDYKHIQLLKIEKHHLTELPEEFSLLSGSLLGLSLSDNKLTSFPKVIFSLKKLQQLEIANNPFQKETLPAEISKLKKLRKLNCSGCNIDAIPVSFSSMRFLTHLNLSSNCLAVWHPEINSVTTLTHINLEHNHIQEIPPTISDLKVLEELNVKSNHLTTLPKELGLIFSLKTLEIQKNKFKTNTRFYELSQYNKELISYLKEQAGVTTPAAQLS